MNGYPKHINTKADVENLLADADYKTRATADLQTLLDGRYQWIMQGQLDAGYSAAAEAGHKIVTVSNAGGAIEKYLFKWDIDSANTLARMGVTATECVSWGCEDRAIACPTT